MLECSKDDTRISNSVEFFSAYNTHKSHGRSINWEMAYGYGLKVRKTEDIEILLQLVQSLYNQYVLWFDKTPFVKNYENRYGVNWGWQASVLVSAVKKWLIKFCIIIWLFKQTTYFLNTKHFSHKAGVLVKFICLLWILSSARSNFLC